MIERRGVRDQGSGIRGKKEEGISHKGGGTHSERSESCVAGAVGRLVGWVLRTHRN
jgi:hypothetical protein